MTDINEIQQIKTFYDKVAEKYATNFKDEIFHKPLDQKLLQLFLDKIIKLESNTNSEKTSIFEIGCGTGEVSRYIAEQIKSNNLNSRSLQIIGSDLSEEMIKEAKSLNPDIDFVVDDALQLSLMDNSISGIIAFYMIVNLSVRQITQAFDEFFRVLKPGGIAFVSFHVDDLNELRNTEEFKIKRVEELLGVKASLNFMFYKNELIQGLLEKSGFEIEEALTRYPNISVEYASTRGYIIARKPVIENLP